MQRQETLTELLQCHFLHSAHLVQDPHAQRPQLRLDRHDARPGSCAHTDEVGSRTNEYVLDIWVYVEQDMVHQERKKRFPALGRAQERRIASAVREENAVEDELFVWVCALHAYMRYRRRRRRCQNSKEKVRSRKKTYGLDIVRQNLAHPLRVECK